MTMKMIYTSTLATTATLALAIGILATPQTAKADICSNFHNNGVTPEYSVNVNDNGAIFTPFTLGGNGVPTTPSNVVCGEGSVATGTNVTTLGANTVANTNGTALGQGASATGNGSVALGQGSTDGGVAGVVSIGAVGTERRVINVAAGTFNTDAVNLTQLNVVDAHAATAQSTANTAVSAATFALSNALTALTTATTAQTTATTAATDAATALGNATTAISTATNAQSTANTALTNAATAQTTANTALANTTYVAVGGTGALPIVTGTGAVAIGIGQQATGNGAVAIGDPNTATGTGAVAVGADNTATGNGAVAIGNANTAGANGAVALGNGANAGQVNAVALGSGATTTRANQVKLGGTASSVTIGDIAASTTAQVGPTDVMTVDSSGTIGRDPSIRSSIASQGSAITTIQALDTIQNGRLGTLETNVTQLNTNIIGVDQRAEGGIAAAMAMGGTIIPADANGAISFNLSTYRGQQGFSGVIVQKVSSKVYANFGIAGSTVKGSTGARVGVTIGW
jgi:trimeric autotransporter adhesin